MQNVEFDVLVIGGGAAGFFAAVNTAEMNSNLRIAILEKTKNVLSKVRISGGGRCNVTHAEYQPHELVRNYPRGEKELLGPFHKFMTGDVVAWFEERGVPLKTESDGRMFPITDDSQTIIDCLTGRASDLGIQVWNRQIVQTIVPDNEGWKVHTQSHAIRTHQLLIATGSSSRMWQMLEELGHRIVPPVPSLFTFNIEDERIADLPGVASDATVQVLEEARPDSALQSTGPVMITHWGLSGPAILKLSAWGARTLAFRKYRFQIMVNWLVDTPTVAVEDQMKEWKSVSGKQLVSRQSKFGMPKRLWWNLVEASGISPEMTWGDLGKKQIRDLARQLTAGVYEVNGKSTFKEEFVTAGGVSLREINFQSFQSKIHPGLYLAGEVLDVDALTGGFNFQNAWTGAYLAAKSMAHSGHSFWQGVTSI